MTKGEKVVPSGGDGGGLDPARIGVLGVVRQPKRYTGESHTVAPCLAHELDAR